MPSTDPPRSKNERIFRGVLTFFSIVAAVVLAAHFALGIWSQHSYNQVEAIIATQAEMFAEGGGIYSDVNDYPFTINAYGPIFYSLLAALYLLGFPVLLAGRLISIAALCGTIYLTAKTTGHLTGDRYAAWTAGLIAALTANLLSWGSAGQTDMLALFFSVLAFYLYLRYESDNKVSFLIASGTVIALAIFVKQSFLAAGAAVSILMLLRRRQSGVAFVATLGVSGVLVALGINELTDGGYFDHGIRGNIFPFSLHKVQQHVSYFSLVFGWLLLIAAAAPIATRRLSTVHLYLACALVMLSLTAAKVGSDLNCQMETSVLLCIAAGWSLHQLDFFRLYFRNDPGWVTLLQIPLVLYLVLNVALCGRSLLGRFVLEQDHRAHSAAMAPYLAPDAGRVLSVEIDPLLDTRKHIEVEPLVYTMLVRSGLIDPEPVRRDLLESRFATVALYQNIFDDTGEALDSETPSLPPDHLQIVRENYRLVEHVIGPYLGGVYIYQPRAFSEMK